MIVSFSDDSTHQVSFQTWPVHDVGSEFVWNCFGKFPFHIIFDCHFTIGDGIMLLTAVRDHFTSAVVMKMTAKIRIWNQIQCFDLLAFVYAAIQFLLRMPVENCSKPILSEWFKRIKTNNQSVPAVFILLVKWIIGITASRRTNYSRLGPSLCE